MILLDIKNYIKAHQQVSNDDLTNHFDISDDTLDALIRPLLKQGHIERLPGSTCSSQCGTSCASNTAKTLFRWKTKAQPNLLFPVEVH